ncbi:MAG: hypothetical protein LBF25_02320 [Puniceicoccales bacterium]|jgi:hypothetical protein|nr:hypothetical protein [Puniceicoccales bacterium]
METWKINLEHIYSIHTIDKRPGKILLVVCRAANKRTLQKRNENLSKKIAFMPLEKYSASRLFHICLTRLIFEISHSSQKL